MTKEKISDSWATPQALFDELDKEFNFDIDLCATKENSKCDDYCIDYLKDKAVCISESHEYTFKLACTDWLTTAFMNPPYSNPKPFIEKAWEDARYCRIVCLVKCDPSTKWWSTFWLYDVPKYVYFDIESVDGCVESFIPLDENDRYMLIRTENYNGPKPGCEIRFFPKRIKFDPPQELIDSKQVWREGNKWYQVCDKGDFMQYRTHFKYIGDKINNCPACKGKGYKELSGPTFSSALLIFYRRTL